MKKPILYALRCCALLSFLFSFLLHAQTKNVASSKNNKNIQKPADIYVAGNYAVQGQFFGPAYTKNGERTPLTQTEYGLAKAIQVVGDDVYVAGDIKDKAVYWKNGQAHYLTCSEPTSTATCIAVVGDDVYVGGNGSKNGDNVYPRYWKNGQEIVLPRHIFSGMEAGTYVTNIAVIENDVYVIGTAVYEPVYWKNGQKVNAINNDLQRVVAIKEVNGDVYAIGGKDKHAAYWKNGQTKVLSSEESMATAITIDGNDVYVAGVIGEYFSKNMYPGYGNSGTGYLWKNGVQQKLENDVYPFSIAVSAGDVYITGMDQNYASYRLLKNGQRIESEVDPMYVVSAGKGNGYKEVGKKGNFEKKESAKPKELAISQGNGSFSKSIEKKGLSSNESNLYLKEKQEADQYLAKMKKLSGMIETPSGLLYQVLKEGTGPRAKLDQWITVDYKISFPDGITRPGHMGGVGGRFMPCDYKMKGMQEAFQLMQAEGIYRIIVPYELAEGKTGSRDIPPYQVWIYEVQLRKIEN